MPNGSEEVLGPFCLRIVEKLAEHGASFGGGLTLPLVVSFPVSFANIIDGTDFVPLGTLDSEVTRFNLLPRAGNVVVQKRTSGDTARPVTV